MSIDVNTDLSTSTGKVTVAAGAPGSRKRATGSLVLATIEGQNVVTFVPDVAGDLEAVEAADS